MAWIYLFIASIFEVAWAISLKYTSGLTKFWPSLITIISMVMSFVFLSQAVKSLPLGTSYAIWTGIGVVGTTILGIMLFDEPREIIRVICIMLIILGILGLKITS